MISVLIETQNSEDDLPRTLASLISGAVEGIVRDVIVCDAGSTDHTQKVADVAGCEFLTNGGIAAGIAQAKSDWLLVLEPGAALVDGWIEDVARHCAKATIAARLRRARSVRTPFLGRILGSKSNLAEGLLIRKSQALALSRDGRNAEGLGRGVATRQIEAEIVPADGKRR